MERAAYRIIDANFNRAREAIRVVEDYCRFVVNCAPLAERAKQLRHELSGTAAKLDIAKLISSRDTPGDVGVGAKVPGQLERADLLDCCTAGCKRLTEALRVLAEVAQTEHKDVAEQIERLRYEAYTLEKDIVVFASPAEKFKRVRLYVVVTSNLPVEALSLCSKCVAGGADCIQLRAKAIDDDKLFALAQEFVGICADGGVLSIINDRVDVAAAARADGVHVGQNDMPVDQIKKLQTEPLIIGKSTHSPAELDHTCRELPTYVSLGPVFATPTKPAMKAVGLSYVEHGIRRLMDTGIGHVAIGGITAENVEQVLRAGARAVAVCSAVSTASDPTETCRVLKDKITAFEG